MKGAGLGSLYQEIPPSSPPSFPSFPCYHADGRLCYHNLFSSATSSSFSASSTSSSFSLCPSPVFSPEHVEIVQGGQLSRRRGIQRAGPTRPGYTGKINGGKERKRGGNECHLFPSLLPSLPPSLPPYLAIFLLLLLTHPFKRLDNSACSISHQLGCVKGRVNDGHTNAPALQLTAEGVPEGREGGREGRRDGGRECKPI